MDIILHYDFLHKTNEFEEDHNFEFRVREGIGSGDQANENSDFWPTINKLQENTGLPEKELFGSETEDEAYPSLWAEESS